MTTVPGSAGLPLVSDKSYEFYKDPVKFVEKNFNYYKSRIFCARFLNKPTIFIGSNKLLGELLQDCTSYMELGYKAFMEEIYGDNILFTEGEAAKSLRHSLSQLFTVESIEAYRNTVHSIVSRAVVGLDTEQPQCLYTLFKCLATEVCLSLFLGLDFTQARGTAETIVSLTTEHWHGMISFPLSFKLPMLNASSYRKALDAKAKLLKIIDERRSEAQYTFCEKLESALRAEHICEDKMVNNHLLLFTTALVPKAIASMLTSLTLELGKEDKVHLQDEIGTDTQLLDFLILETERLYPPFFGGRRISKEKFDVGGYKFPEGHALVYLTYAAHRDPVLFEYPDQFMPDRWKDRNAGDRDKLFTFGSGPRSCVGQSLVVDIIKTTVVQLFDQFRVTVLEGQDLSHKWLPVSRPQKDILVRLHKRQ